MLYAVAADDGAPLSESERRILALLREGKADAEIAVWLEISVGDLKDRVERMQRRIGARSRDELVARFAGRETSQDAPRAAEPGDPTEPRDASGPASPASRAPRAVTRRALLAGSAGLAVGLAAGGGALALLRDRSNSNGDRARPSPTGGTGPSAGAGASPGPTDGPYGPFPTADQPVRVVTGGPDRPLFGRLRRAITEILPDRPAIHFLNTKDGAIESLEPLPIPGWPESEPAEWKVHRGGFTVHGLGRQTLWTLDRRSGAETAWLLHASWSLMATTPTHVIARSEEVQGGRVRVTVFDHDAEVVATFVVESGGAPPTALATSDARLLIRTEEGDLQLLTLPYGGVLLTAPRPAGLLWTGRYRSRAGVIVTFENLSTGQRLARLIRINEVQPTVEDYPGAGFVSPSSLDPSVIAERPVSGARPGLYYEWPAVEELGKFGATARRTRSATLNMGETLEANRWTSMTSYAGLALVREGEGEHLEWLEFERAADAHRLPWSTIKGLGPPNIPTPVPSPFEPWRVCIGNSAYYDRSRDVAWVPRLGPGGAAGNIDPWSGGPGEMVFATPQVALSKLALGFKAFLAPTYEDAPAVTPLPLKFVTETPGDVLRLRENPSLEAAIVATLPHGTPVLFAPIDAPAGEGPTSTEYWTRDGITWVHVRDSEDHQGWVARQYLRWAEGAGVDIREATRGWDG